MTLNTSIIGKNKIDKAIMNLLLESIFTSSKSTGPSARNRIHNILIRNPTIKDPVSPMKILRVFEKLNRRKAIKKPIANIDSKK